MKTSSTLLLRRYRTTKRKFDKFQLRFQKALQRAELTQFKLSKLHQRLRKFHKQLLALNHQLKVGGAALAVGLTVMATEADAQQRTPAFATPTSDPFGLSIVGNSHISFADLDGDGDLDALLGEYDGTLNYFENTGDKNTPTFAAAVSNPFGLTTIAGGRSVPRVGDIDSDGDLDLFIGSNDGNTYYFENTGDANNPTFATVATNPFGITNVGNRVAPRLADLDGDGDLDLLIGSGNNGGGALDARFNYFENTGNMLSPTFAANISNPFGITVLNTSIVPEWSDIDQDGDVDLLFGNYDGALVYAENTGDKISPTFAANISNPFNLSDIGARSSPTFVDLDGDGDLDLFVPEDDATLNYFENTGTYRTHFFAPSSQSPFGFTDIGLYFKPSFADIDGDGDLDALVGNPDGNLNYFENTGNNTNPTFAASVTNPFGLTDIGSYATPSFADLDGDGDLDALVGHSIGNLNYFENTGNNTNPTFAASVTNPFGFTDVGVSSTPSFADLDGDGDLDAFVGERDGLINYFENTGNNTNPTFAAAVTNPFGFIDVGAFSTPSFVDFDGDGDLDVFVGEGAGDMNYFENTGNNTNPTFATVATNVFGFLDIGGFSSPSVVDIDGDGDMDVFVGEEYGEVFYYEAVPTIIWNTNWNNTSGPTALDDAIIASDFDVNTNGSITSLDLTINSGQTLTMTSGSIQVAGDFDNNGNAFTQTGGTFTFNGSSAQTVEGSNTFDDVVINNAAGVTLNSTTDVTGVLTLTSGTLTSGGNLTLKSTASTAGGTATVSFGGGNVSGNVTQERFLDGGTQRGYRYIGTAVAGQTMANINDDVTLNHLGSVFSPGTNISTYDRDGYSVPLPNIFYYDQSLVSSGTISMGDLNGSSFDDAEIGWEIPSSTVTTFNPGSSVALNISASDVTLDFTGTLQSTDVILSLAHGGQTNSGWQLVGNPFAATLDWNAVYEDAGNSGVEATAYVFDADGEFSGNYAGFNAATDAGVNGGTKDIASGQGFFIQTSSGMTGNVTLKTSHTAATDVQFFRTTTETPEWHGELRLKLIDQQQDIADELLLYFIEGAQNEQDVGDAKKFFGTAYGLPELSSKAFGFDLLMDCRAPLNEEMQTFELALKSGKAGTYTLTAATIAKFEVGTEIYLEDLQENKLIDLNQTSTYQFEITENEQFIENRFRVHLRTNRVTSLEDDLAQQGVVIFAHDKQVTIHFSDVETAKSEIAVYDLMGRLIYQEAHASTLSIQIPIQKQGVYIVKVKNVKGFSSQKVMIR